MRLSVIVVVHEMAREAPRTLRSLATGYQNAIAPDAYEVIVVDNGSRPPLGAEVVESFGSNFRYVYVPGASPSPAGAVSLGATRSTGDLIAVFIDGARIASPGILAQMLAASCLHPDPIVATTGWHLGPGPQQLTVPAGYTRQEEDRLLASIGWPADGYRLFEVSALAPTSSRGLFLAPAESNALALRRDTFQRLGGYDGRFDLPGGGLVNHDFLHRAVDGGSRQLILLVGEGTFHQLHGGISTNVSPDENLPNLRRWRDQYRRPRGVDWSFPAVAPWLLGHVRRELRRHLPASPEPSRGATAPGDARRRGPGYEP